MKQLLSLVLLSSFAFASYAIPVVPAHDRECKGRGQHPDGKGGCVCNLRWHLENGVCVKNRTIK